MSEEMKDRLGDRCLSTGEAAMLPSYPNLNDKFGLLNQSILTANVVNGSDAESHCSTETQVVALKNEFCVGEHDLDLFEQSDRNAAKRSATTLKRSSLYRKFDPLCASPYRPDSPINSSIGWERQDSRLLEALSPSIYVKNDGLSESLNLAASPNALRALQSTNALFDSRFVNTTLFSSPGTPRSCVKPRHKGVEALIKVTPSSCSSANQCGVLDETLAMKQSSGDRSTTMYLSPRYDASFQRTPSPEFQLSHSPTFNCGLGNGLWSENLQARFGNCPPNTPISACSDRTTKTRRSPIQEVVRKLAFDIEEYLNSARAQVAGYRGTTSKSAARSRSSDVVSSRRRTQSHNIDYDYSRFTSAEYHEDVLDVNTSARERADQMLNAFVSLQSVSESTACEPAAISTTVTECESEPTPPLDYDYERLVEAERNRLRAEFLKKWAEQQRAYEAKHAELSRTSAALNHDLAEKRQVNSDFASLIRAFDKRLMLGSELRRRNESKQSVTQQEVHQLSLAFSERLKLESAAQSAIVVYEQQIEGEKNVQARLAEATKKTADAYNRLSTEVLSITDHTSRECSLARRETEAQRAELETRCRKLRVDIDALRGSLQAKNFEANELNLIIAQLTTRLSEARGEIR